MYVWSCRLPVSIGGPPRLLSFLLRSGFEKSDFHGCAYGLKNMKGQFMKKPWTVATTSAIVARGVVRTCDGSHTHIMARGRDCKNAEGYTDELAMHVHTLLKCACVSRLCPFACSFAFACPAPVMTGSDVDAVQGSTPQCSRYALPPP